MKRAWTAISGLCIVIFLIAMLPTLELVESSSCDFAPQTSAKREADAPLPGKISLGVRVGDKELLAQLRAIVERELKAKGVTEIVENSVTFPRVDVVVQEWNGRWTPFWGSARVVGRVFVDTGKNKRAVDATVNLDGACQGLLSKRAWSAGVLEPLGVSLVAAATQ